MSARLARAGYTAVEVLMAMTVMAIGAAAVMSMQKASVQGNLDARQTDIANSIARTWAERIQRDAMQWTTPGPSHTDLPDNLNAASLLQYGAVSSAGRWFLPTLYLGNAVPTSPGFDMLGRDLPNAQLGTAFFCTHLRVSSLDPTGLYRLDVRVLWPRGIVTALTPGATTNVCDTSVATDDRPDPKRYHAIYLTTAVKANPQ
ncbi:MAG: prepilin-type N-terminal cleavage/methylation domain-containing protein [Myxococcales bacterium]|nr:prepilin-type N-terminal cleavage/methylation domain-containing protein [Myxococcales bacterium]